MYLPGYMSDRGDAAKVTTYLLVPSIIQVGVYVWCMKRSMAGRFYMIQSNEEPLRAVAVFC